MNAWRATLGSAHMQPASIELDLMPFQVAHLRRSQAVAIGDKDHGGIAMAMPIALGSLNELPNLALGKVATSNCEAFSAWRAGIASLFSHEKSLSSENDWKDNTPFLHSQQSGLSEKERKQKKKNFPGGSLFFLFSVSKMGPVLRPTPR
jgi:hypothetical protein